MNNLIHDLIEYNPKREKNWISQRDPRVKFLFTIVYLILAVYFSNYEILLSIAVLIFVFIIIANGLKSSLKIFFSLKWFFIILIGTFFIYSRIFPEFNFYAILAKLIIILLAFNIFSSTTSPDKFFEMLISFKIPPRIAWSISVAIRQAIFLIDNFEEMRNYEMLKLNSKTSNNLIKSIFSMRLYSQIYAQALLNTEEMTDALISRNWQYPHKDISLYKIKINNMDLLFVFITIFIPFIFILILSNYYFIH